MDLISHFSAQSTNLPCRLGTLTMMPCTPSLIIRSTLALSILMPYGIGTNIVKSSDAVSDWVFSGLWSSKNNHLTRSLRIRSKNNNVLRFCESH